ncbi:DNA-directed RNA polymerase subunit omega [Haploplasma modicum]|jgi:DNA-directed RNA polymerase subunit omega|uniref:DNA-directed RNA polymerase subunit omega n=1 Tax=Haploplasma modicum TaxID=2150 RepID=UPI00054F0DD3|nr:DNA-directed RNA polymerase subunit omega [Haploplasma modicum]MCR1808980.1 DNA-directed RNA polymerase subunit omega [Haploplasma modicum]
MEKNKDGMRYPSIDNLLEKIDSKYKLVYAASKVAEIIERDELYIKDAKCLKSIGIALEEILKDRVEIEFE